MQDDPLATVAIEAMQSKHILTHTSNAKSDLTFNISFIMSLIVTKFKHKKDKSFLNK